MDMRLKKHFSNHSICKVTTANENRYKFSRDTGVYKKGSKLSLVSRFK